MLWRGGAPLHGLVELDAASGEASSAPASGGGATSRARVLAAPQVGCRPQTVLASSVRVVLAVAQALVTGAKRTAFKW